MTKITKDTLWKGIIEDLYEDFCFYFFPDWAAKEIDFSQEPEFLDKEFEQKLDEHPYKKKFLDKVIKLPTKTGNEKHVILHVEVQGYMDKDFAKRMYAYFSLLFTVREEDIVALTIFTDNVKGYEPNKYHYQRQKTSLTYTFDTFKVLEKSEESLWVAGNPFSVVMVVARKALMSDQLDDISQLSWKKELVKKMKENNYSLNKISKIFKFLRYYVNFNNNENLELLDKDIKTTFNFKGHMGIEEGIAYEIKEQIRQKGKQEGIQLGELKEKKERIRKALKRGKLTIEEIVEDFDVDKAFVLDIKNQKI